MENKIKKTLNIMLLLAILLWGSFAVLWWQFGNMQEKIVQLSQEAFVESQKNTSSLAVRNALNNAEGDIKKIESYVVTEDGVVDFIQFVESLADSAGVSLDVNQVSFEDEEKRLLSIHMVSEGSWQETFHFVSLLENIPYRAQFERLNLLFQGESNWRGDYRVNVVSR